MIQNNLIISDLGITRKTSCKHLVKFQYFLISLSYYKGSTMKNYYDGRYGGTTRFWNQKSYRRPEDEQGLVGYQE